MPNKKTIIRKEQPARSRTKTTGSARHAAKATTRGDYLILVPVSVALRVVSTSRAAAIKQVLRNKRVELIERLQSLIEHLQETTGGEAWVWDGSTSTMTKVDLGNAVVKRVVKDDGKRMMFRETVKV